MFKFIFVALVAFFGANTLFAFDQVKFYDGKELFKRCAPCHGEFGEKEAMGKSGEISKRSEAEIRAVLSAYAGSKSAGAMQAQSSLLDSDKIGSLAHYISHMTTKRGEELYGAKCFGCHGAKGEKAAFGKSGKISRLNEKQIADVLNGYKTGKFAKGTTESAMQGRALNLSDHDVSALARYISTIK